MSVSGGQDNLRQVCGALLPAGDERENQSRNAVFRTPYDLQAPNLGNIPPGRWLKKGTGSLSPGVCRFIGDKRKTQHYRQHFSK